MKKIDLGRGRADFIHLRDLAQWLFAAFLSKIKCFVD